MDLLLREWEINPKNPPLPPAGKGLNIRLKIHIMAGFGQKKTSCALFLQNIWVAGVNRFLYNTGKSKKEDGAMKITDVKTIIAKHYLFVKIDTDEGITGLGEAGNWGYLKAVEQIILKFREYLIGKDPFNTEDFYQNFYRSVYFRGSVIMSAISAIDIALWDIKGKALGVPVYQLLGGKTRDKVRVYASVMTAESDLDALAEGYCKLKEQGFTAAKIFMTESAVSPDGSNEFYSARMERSLERLRRCREAVGPDFDFVLEVHRSMSVAQAVAFAAEAEQYRPMALEDPVPPDDPAAMAEVAAKIRIPIASGERFINLHEFETLLSMRGAQYIRPDVCAVGGITASKKICAVAEAHSALVIPHNPLGPVSTAACLQLCASIPNLGIQELPGFCLNGKEDAMVKQPLRFMDGCLLLPETPGIGVELAENVEELYPPQLRGSNSARRGFDGCVRDF